MIERCSPADFNEIVTHLPEFWGSDRARAVHHPMFVHEFGNCAFVIRRDGMVAAYLFGFFSQTEPLFYVHLIGVRDRYQRTGLGRRLYSHVQSLARARGCTEVKAITTPANAASIAFHTALGMKMLGAPQSDGVPVVKDYAGPGGDRVVFRMLICKGE